MRHILFSIILLFIQACALSAATAEQRITAVTVYPDEFPFPANAKSP